MTNGTTPTETGVADAATLAVITNEAIASTSEPIAAPELTGPSEPKPPSFDDLGLHPDVKLALDDMGYFAPTPVQTAVYQPVTDGKDLLVQSRTGTGKTTAFGLPLINRLVPTHRAPQALILCPTRELALQVSRELTQLGKHRGILIEAVYGGAPIGKQIKALRDGVHIIVGTPGRVLDHIGRRTLDCRTISTFVLDECDEMLSMGFLEDIEKITSYIPEKHQTLLFSATMPDEVSRYARRHMHNQEQISLSRDSVSVAEIHHAYYIVSGIARSRDLLKIIFAEDPESAIIFCNTRDETTMVAKFLQKQGLDAEPLSSDLSQADRERVMGRMKAKNLRFLCATDVAARGIDISNLSHVINYSVPEAPEIYVHRTGRTGRAGKKGTALSMVGPRELGNFRYVRLQFGIKPEERLLPKDDIFIGKLKVPLPPVGVPQPPDPIQILIRGVPGTPSDLERQIFEKLLGSANGKRVLATLVADKLNQLSTRNAKPRPARVERDHGPEAEHGDRPERSERPRFGDDRPRFDRDRGDRPRFDRDRGDRPGGSDRGPREDRPRFEGGERGPREDRPRFEGGERGPREDRPRFEGGERGPREDRPRFNEGGERGDRPDRDRGDRGERRFDRDRGDRPRFDRDRGERRPDRDRPERNERHERHDRHEPAPAIAAPVQDATAAAEAVVIAAAPVEVTAIAEPRAERHHERSRDRRDRERDTRGELPQHQQEVVAEAEPEVVTKVDEVARAALDRADRGKKRTSPRTAPTEDSKEFWETWAETKTTREDAPPTRAPAAEGASDAAAEPERKERGGRDRGRGRDRRGRGADKEASDKPVKKDDDRGRAKRDTTVEAAADASQARLFVSLGKKHGVSADDLRTLLAGPIGGETARIGSVSLRDSHAHVRVPEELVDTIIAGVHGTLHKEHNVTVERSRA